MKRLFELILCCVAFAGASLLGNAAGSPAYRVQFAGRDWYELSGWGKVNALGFSWNRPARLARLTNSTTRLDFSVDSPQAVINGVKVWLSLPVTPRGNSLYISALDVDSVLRPILRPQRPSPPRKLKTIMLDPGHGGRDPGNEDGGEQEKRYTLLLAQQLRAKLQSAGFAVVMTRTRDVFLDVSERASLANRAKADLFISLHFNSIASRAAAAQGIETYCLTPVAAASTHDSARTASSSKLAGHKTTAESVLLAYQVQKALVRKLGMVDRGVKHARFVVLRDANMPAILVEGGFMSTRSELKRIMDANFRARTADAIVEAVKAYRSQVGG